MQVLGPRGDDVEMFVVGEHRSGRPGGADGEGAARASLKYCWDGPGSRPCARAGQRRRGRIAAVDSYRPCYVRGPGGISVGLAEQLSYRSIQPRRVSKVDLDGAMISASAADAAAPSAAGSSTAKSPTVVILVCVPWRRGPVDLIWAETFPEIICIPQSPLASGGTLGP